MGRISGRQRAQPWPFSSSRKATAADKKRKSSKRPMKKDVSSRKYWSMTGSQLRMVLAKALSSARQTA